MTTLKVSEAMPLVFIAIDVKLQAVLDLTDHEVVTAVGYDMIHTGWWHN